MNDALLMDVRQTLGDFAEQAPQAIRFQMQSVVDGRSGPIVASSRLEWSIVAIGN